MIEAGSGDGNTRILAVDYGRRRIGLAVSDPTGTIATSIGTVTVENEAQAVKAVAAEVDRWRPVRVIVGLPLQTSGDEGPMAQEALAFAAKLRAALSDTPVEMLDERFTSHEAQRYFHMGGGKLKGRKGTIDRLAAQILLQHYLDAAAMRRERDDA